MNVLVEITQNNKLTDTIKGMNKLFLGAVIVPTFLSIVYFGFIASDVYISESHFVVQGAEKKSASPMAALLKSSGDSDSSTVQDYMLSRDALKLLVDKLSIDKAFSNKNVDIFARFGVFDYYNNFERLYLYYQDKVTVASDPLSSITILTVKSFSAEDSFHINEQLLELSEVLVNQLNEVVRKDLIRFASNEVAIAEQKDKAAALALSKYRNQKGVINPEKETELQLGQVLTMQEQKLDMEAQLTQLQSFAKNNPQIPSLQSRIKKLKQQIDEEVKEVTGNEHSLADKAGHYQSLVVEHDFTTQQLASTLISLEQARNEAQRKQLYLKRIVQPNKPDKAMEPRRIHGVLSTLVLGLIVWGVLTLLIAGVKEHQD